MQYIKSLIGITEPKPFIELASMGAYWQDRVSLFEALQEPVGSVMFIGDSFTDGCEWAELFNDPNILNRGIRGEQSSGILLRISEACSAQPAKIFLKTGFNDIAIGISTPSIIKNCQSVIDSIRLKSPQTEIYWQGLLPDRDIPNVPNDTIQFYNCLLAQLCEKNGCHFIQLYALFADTTNTLRPELTHDGIHLTGEGYTIWREAIGLYVRE